MKSRCDTTTPEAGGFCVSFASLLCWLLVVSRTARGYIGAIALENELLLALGVSLLVLPGLVLLHPSGKRRSNGRTGVFTATTCALLVTLGALVVTASASSYYEGLPARSALAVGGLTSQSSLTAVTAAVLGGLFTGAGLLSGDRDQTRTVVVGDDPEKIAAALNSAEYPVVGYLDRAGSDRSQGYLVTSEPDSEAGRWRNRDLVTTDGGIGEIGPVEELTELSDLERVLGAGGIDTVLLAYRETCREGFFGALRTCHDHGLEVKVHESHADQVLVDGDPEGTFVDVDIEPWPWYGRTVKRTFDVVVSVIGLIALSPVIVLVAAAIKVESRGSIFYTQTRTARFGATFPIVKFRTLHLESEEPVPQSDAENDRVTDLGRVLRKTHMDELPQLVTILFGRMSVVGPRAVWTDEESLLVDEVEGWRKRWAVKPGLTGLAQVRGASSTTPQKKLEHDLDYIRRQSVWLDLVVVCKQLRIVFGHVLLMVLRRGE